LNRESVELSPEICTNLFSSKKQQQQQQLISPKNNAASKQQSQFVAIANPAAPTSNSNPVMRKASKGSKGSLTGPNLTSSYSGAPTAMSEQHPSTTAAANHVANHANLTSPTNNTATITRRTPASKPSTSLPLQPPPPPTNTTRSKRMLVVDPKSGHKYHLHPDDHSLTDKELHIYHKKNRKKPGNTSFARAAKSDGAAAALLAIITAENAKAKKAREERITRSRSEGSRTTSSSSAQHTVADDNNDEHTDTGTLNTYHTADDLETLETASALTEVSYYGRYKVHSGPFECIIPTSCRSVEQLALGDLQCYNAVGEEEAMPGGRLASRHTAAVEGRDDVESVERGRYKHLLEGDANNNGMALPKKVGLKVNTSSNNNVNDQEEQVTSPMTALNSLVSPRISNLAASFFTNTHHQSTNNTNTNRLSTPQASQIMEVKFRRISLILFPQEIHASLQGTSNNGRGVGLLGMTFCQNGHGFQANVEWVQRGSKAERMGVRKGDVVSFAVALSNMTEEQNSFLAEKLIKRLESVGMRTSYRELYDIFLSKTTNCRPIGMVFRRWKGKHHGHGTNGGMSPMNNGRITNEFEWSTDFLQSLAIKCREYEFQQKVPLTMDNDASSPNAGDADTSNKLQSFLPIPNVNAAPPSNNGIVVDYLNGLLDNLTTRYSCANTLPMMKCIESTLGVVNQSSSSTGKQTETRKQADDTNDSNEFLSNRILCSLVEQSMGLIFLRRVPSSSSAIAAQQAAQTTTNKGATMSGSGFAVVRKAEGSWSAPCFLSILGSKDNFTESNDTTTDNNNNAATNMMYNNSSSSSHPSEDVKMIVIRKKEMVNNLILGNAVKFSARKEERANVLVRDAAVIGVREGRFQLASDFFLAVKVNDVQNQGAYSLSTDHIEAEDILTGTISPPEQSVDFYGALQSLELPYSMHSHPVIPEMLQRYSDSDWVEFLPDHESTAESSCGMRTKLQMISQRNSSMEDKREIDIFARKFKYYLMDGVPVHRVLSLKNSGLTEEKVLRLTIKDPESLFSSLLELTRKRRPGVSNVGIPSNFSTTFENITKLSRSPPAALANNLDEEEKKRFFSFETDLSPGPVMMLAKSKKDAMILLCGLKLLLEREKRLSY